MISGWLDTFFSRQCTVTGCLVTNILETWRYLLWWLIVHWTHTAPRARLVCQPHTSPCFANTSLMRQIVIWPIYPLHIIHPQEKMCTSMLKLVSVIICKLSKIVNDCHDGYKSWIFLLDVLQWINIESLVTDTLRKSSVVFVCDFKQHSYVVIHRGILKWLMMKMITQTSKWRVVMCWSSVMCRTGNRDVYYLGKLLGGRTQELTVLVEDLIQMLCSSLW